MFNLGWGEMVVIGIVALIAIGPKELPTVLRTLGQYMAKIKRMASEFQGQFQEAMREAEFADLKKEAEDLSSSVGDLSSIDPMTDVETEMKAAFEPDEPAKLAAPAAETATEVPAQPSEPAVVAQPDVTSSEPTPVAKAEDAAPAPPLPKQAGGSA